jgi:hypothetical protein
VARAQDIRGVEYGQPIVFENSLEGFELFVGWFRKIMAEHGCEDVVVGMEPTGHYWLNLAVSEGSKSHVTWGKRKMGIVVTGIYGKSIGLGSSLFRSPLKFVPWELAHFTIWHMVIPSNGHPLWMALKLAVTDNAMNRITNEENFFGEKPHATSVKL